MQEEEKNKLLETGKYEEKRKKEKKSNDGDVAVQSEERGVTYRYGDIEDGIDEAKVASKKHDKKKSRGTKAMGEREVIDDKGFTTKESEKKANVEKGGEKAELVAKKDGKRVKKKKKGHNDKEDITTSLELLRKDLAGANGIDNNVSDKGKEKGKKKKIISKNKVGGEVGPDLYSHKERRKEKDGWSSVAKSSETSVIDRVSDDNKKSTRNNESLKFENSSTQERGKEKMEDVKKKKRKKEKVHSSEVSASLLSEYCTKTLGDVGTLVTNYVGSHHEECEGSNDKKKKKKRKGTDSSLGLQKDEKDRRKKIKQALSAAEKEIAEGADAGMRSSMLASLKKEKRRTEGNMEPAGNLKLSPEEIPNNEVNDEGGAAKHTVNDEISSVRKDRSTAAAKSSQSKEKKRKVRFSGKVEVFPPANDTEFSGLGKNHLVQGKRFSLEEDAKILEAIDNYIEVNQLGEEGKHMIINCRKYPQVKDCWKEIGASVPYRPYTAVYNRGHSLLERSEKKKWEPEEYEILRRFHEQHGAKWKILAESLGKFRVHVKDAWRRIRLPNRRTGHWSQDEYQALFDLVNMDLQMKAFEEKKTKHGMLKDNISWEAISEKMSTRDFRDCCRKWYGQLVSPLVSEGVWTDADDYRLLDALQNLDACCVEDVDWDSLLEHRSGEICRKRWSQMVRHIGAHQELPFLEQLEVLLKRYSPDMLEYRARES